MNSVKLGTQCLLILLANIALGSFRCMDRDTHMISQPKDMVSSSVGVDRSTLIEVLSGDLIETIRSREAREALLRVREGALDINAPLFGDPIFGWGQTLAHVIVKEGNLPALSALRQAGADASKEDWQGNTLPLIAAWTGQVEMLKLLLASGLDPRHSNKVGCTLLHEAAAGRQLEPLKLLIEVVVDLVHTADNSGNTALHTATMVKNCH